MKNKQFILLLLFVPLFINLKCRKDDTPQGYHFQCKLDGILYIPDGFCANCLQATILYDTVLMLGANRNIETLGIGINDKEGIRPIQYQLNHIIGRRGDYKNSFTTDDRFFTDSLRTGQLIITRLDKTKKEIEGTFYFKAYNIVQNKTVNITEGKFRLSYKNY